MLKRSLIITFCVFSASSYALASDCDKNLQGSAFSKKSDGSKTITNVEKAPLTLHKVNENLTIISSVDHNGYLRLSTQTEKGEVNLGSLKLNDKAYSELSFATVGNKLFMSLVSDEKLQIFELRTGQVIQLDEQFARHTVFFAPAMQVVNNELFIATMSIGGEMSLFAFNLDTKTLKLTYTREHADYYFSNIEFQLVGDRLFLVAGKTDSIFLYEIIDFRAVLRQEIRSKEAYSYHGLPLFKWESNDNGRIYLNVNYPKNADERTSDNLKGLGQKYELVAGALVEVRELGERRYNWKVLPSGAVYFFTKTEDGSGSESFELKNAQSFEIRTYDGGVEKKNIYISVTSKNGKKVTFKVLDGKLILNQKNEELTEPMWQKMSNGDLYLSLSSKKSKEVYIFSLKDRKIELIEINNQIQVNSQIQDSEQYTDDYNRK